MKMRHNYPNFHIAKLFSCSVTSIANIIITFLYLFHESVYQPYFRIPSRDQNQLSLPKSFVNFKNCRTVLDCTDVKIAVPTAMDLQSATYSSYRSINSFKILVGVSPNGVITYISEPYPGSVSDKAIIAHCGLSHHLSKGDLVLADKGFLISDLLPEGVTLNIPPFLHKQFTAKEAEQTIEIARARIHVERANARLKQFSILSYIPPWLKSHLTQIVQVVATLVNFQNPLINSDKLVNISNK